MGLNEQLAAEAEGMLRDGLLEGLARRLSVDYPTIPDHVPEAIGHGIEKLIARPVGREPKKPRSYVATCAYNEMKRERKLRARHESLDALRENENGGFEPIDEGWTVEQRALIDEVYRELRAIVQRWETGHVREVTLLYLKAAYEGEPLPSDEAADEIGDMFGEKVDVDFVRTWKSRGYRRLKKQVGQMAAQEAQMDGAP